MTRSLSSSDIRGLRLRGQCLTVPPPGAENIAQVVANLCGVQAQELSAAALAIRARSHGFVATDADHARVRDRSIVRTWAQRGTLHLLAAGDLAWLLPLFGPVFKAGDKRRRAELGLTDEVCDQGSQFVGKLLAEQGPLTRAEIVAQMAGQGIRLEGQAAPHFLFYCAASGILCFGPDRGAEPTYALLDQWVTGWRRSAIPAKVAYAELARRYLRAYGPAQPEDMVSWSGLSLKEVRNAWSQIDDELLELPTNDQSVWLLKSQAQWLYELPPNPPSVRLLPRYDTYLLGYRNRDLVVAPEYAKRINAGGGIVHATVIADGYAVGLWKTRKQKHGLLIAIEPFEKFTSDVMDGIAMEAGDLARFLQTTAELQPL